MRTGLAADSPWNAPAVKVAYFNPTANLAARPDPLRRLRRTLFDPCVRGSIRTTMGARRRMMPLRVVPRASVVPVARPTVGRTP
jgi:hypothetical protein